MTKRSSFFPVWTECPSEPERECRVQPGRVNTPAVIWLSCSVKRVPLRERILHSFISLKPPRPLCLLAPDWQVSATVIAIRGGKKTCLYPRERALGGYKCWKHTSTGGIRAALILIAAATRRGRFHNKTVAHETQRERDAAAFAALLEYWSFRVPATHRGLHARPCTLTSGSEGEEGWGRITAPSRSSGWQR